MSQSVYRMPGTSSFTENGLNSYRAASKPKKHTNPRFRILNSTVSGPKAKLPAPHKFTSGLWRGCVHTSSADRQTRSEICRAYGRAGTYNLFNECAPTALSRAHSASPPLPRAGWARALTMYRDARTTDAAAHSTFSHSRSLSRSGLALPPLQAISDSLSDYCARNGFAAMS